jgi:anti-anti-sigma factor
MELFERQIKKYAIVININLVRATLNEASEFREYLNEAILGSDVDIIVNLSDCQHLDSTFLGVLVSGYKRLKQKNRSMAIIEPLDQSRVFLTLNSIGKIFPLYDSVNSALADIENKKVLETVVDHIDDESIENKIETKTENILIAEPVEVLSHSQILVQEELVAVELEKSVKSSNGFYENETLKNEFEREAEAINKLTAANETIKETINSETQHEIKKVHHKESVKSAEPKQLYSEINFSKGSIDWAFGFN